MSEPTRSGRHRRALTDHRFYALLAFALLTIIIIAGTVMALAAPETLQCSSSV